jgi:two-component system cell cycle sensor histidine kinase/response regulator CckA
VTASARGLGAGEDVPVEGEHAIAELRLFRTLLDRTNDCIEVFDPATTRILDVNERACETLGYTREELLTMKVGDYALTFDLDAFHRRALAPGGNSRTVLLEGLHRRKDGSIYPVEVSVSFAQLDRPYAIAVVRDISERRRLEEQFSHAQKMESVGRLAGGVAHDFNNQLGVIIGLAELAIANLKPTDPLRDDLLEILQAARHSADLTRQLLTFARKQQIVARVFDLNEQVEHSLQMLRRLIGENIRLAWRASSDLWPVKMDPSQVDQILANLCVNARDAIADVGTVDIATANRSLDAAFCARHADAVPGDYVRLSVGDDGCGMTHEVLSRIFEPFFTTKAVGAGTGLGLATVYGAIRQNNGFITAVSFPNKGTTFDIYLPRHIGAIEVAASAEVAPQKRGRETILVVEDEAAVLRMTTRTLEAHGYSVLAASRPDDAIRLAAEHAGAFDLLLTDVVMPGLNGWDLADQLMSSHANLKVLFMTGFAAATRPGHTTPVESAQFIAKPFDPATLTSKVRAALDRP